MVLPLQVLRAHPSSNGDAHSKCHEIVKIPIDANCIYNLGILKSYGLSHLEKVDSYLDVHDTSCSLFEFYLCSSIMAIVDRDPQASAPLCD